MLYQLSYIGPTKYPPVTKSARHPEPSEEPAFLSHRPRLPTLQSAGFALSRSSSIRSRQKCSAVRKANTPRISNVPVRSLTFPLKTRIGSFDSVVQAKTPSTAYATSARTNFFLIVTQSQVSKFQGFQSKISAFGFFETLKLRNLETFLTSLVHRGGFEPPYLLRGTDLQSVGFNRSPTCANPKTLG